MGSVAANDEVQLELTGDVNSNLQTIFSTLRADNRKAEELAASRHTESLNKFAQLQKRYAVLEKKYVKIEQRQQKLEDEVRQLKGSLNDMQQKALCNRVIIRGAPEVETADGELALLCLSIFGVLGIRAAELEIVEVKRLGRAPDTQDAVPKRPIVAVLREASMCSKIIQAKRAAKQLPCNTVFFKSNMLGSSSEQLYIEELLTSYNSKLYSIARQLKKAGTLKYAWIKNGDLLIREKEKGKVVKIVHEGDLAKWTFKDDNSETETATDLDTDTGTGDHPTNQAITRNQGKRKQASPTDTRAVRRKRH